MHDIYFITCFFFYNVSYSLGYFIHCSFLKSRDLENLSSDIRFEGCQADCLYKVVYKDKVPCLIAVAINLECFAPQALADELGDYTAFVVRPRPVDITEAKRDCFDAECPEVSRAVCLPGQFTGPIR